MILLGIIFVFLVWLVYTAFTLEDVVLKNEYDEDHYE